MSETSLKTSPKVFISYSWSSEKHKDWVLGFAHALITAGVDVVFDRWVLNPGCDKYFFMEKCFSDPDIQKVLIICDKSYKIKADSRKGGVGDETLIISPEMYGNESQEKFIGVVVEMDESGDPCLPIYLRSRMYIDLHDRELEGDNFKDLVRNIYGKPSLKKPQLGSALTGLMKNHNHRMNYKKLSPLFKKKCQFLISLSQVQLNSLNHSLKSLMIMMMLITIVLLIQMWKSYRKFNRYLIHIWVFCILISFQRKILENLLLNSLKNYIIVLGSQRVHVVVINIKNMHISSGNVL